MSIESRVRDILLQKGCNTIWSIDPEETVFAALREMALRNVGALLAIDGNEIVGIVSERDYARKVVLENRSSRTTLVKEIMASPVVAVGPADSAEKCLSLMTENRIRHLPVYEFGQLVGLISMGDVVSAIISDREFIIGQLTHYITDSYGDGFAPRA